MSINEILLLLDKKSKTKVLTNSFNQLSVSDRKQVLALLSKEEGTELIKKLRNQAVADFGHMNRN